MNLEEFENFRLRYIEGHVLETSYLMACSDILPKFLHLTRLVEEAYKTAPAAVKYNKKFLKIREALEDLNT
jgi:hypothetical protein